MSWAGSILYFHVWEEASYKELIDTAANDGQSAKLSRSAALTSHMFSVLGRRCTRLALEHARVDRWIYSYCGYFSDRLCFVGGRELDKTEGVS